MKTGKPPCLPVSRDILWHILLALASYRVPRPVTERVVFPDCSGAPSYYVCPRCGITLEREGGADPVYDGRVQAITGVLERADGYKLDWLEDKLYTTLFVDGNHENFDLLNAYPEREWHGGRVHEIRPHVLHLARGQIFDIGGSTWFAMGGAASHDIQDGILDPDLPDFERRYWTLRRMNARFRVPTALTRGKAQHSGFAAKARSKGANSVFRGSGKRS